MVTAGPSRAVRLAPTLAEPDHPEERSWDARGGGCAVEPSSRRLWWRWTAREFAVGGADLRSASKPYNEDDAEGQQGAGKPESDECLAPVRAVARRLEDPDADAPCVERPNKRGEAAKAERAESRRPGEGAPKYVATGRFRAHGSMMRVAARSVNARCPQQTPTRGASTICRCEAE